MDHDEDQLNRLVKDFRRDGFLVLKDVFKAEFVQALHQAFIQKYQHYFVEKEHEDALCVGDKRFVVTVEVEGAFNTARFYANPFILSIVEQLLGKSFIISDLTCVVSLPGAQRQHIHSDGTIFDGLPIANLLPPHAIGLLIPLIPFNRMNGVTRIWPGTHGKTMPDESLEDDLDFVDPELDIGSCILMDHRLKHRGNANLSDQIRPLLYCNYSAPWYFDSNNFKKQAHLLIKDENFEKVPEEYKAMFARRNMRLA
jgi:ectoine hydroxylase-related dioxygenase (phytanoyl-CoA dioxygenase family)